MTMIAQCIYHNIMVLSAWSGGSNVLYSFEVIS